MVIAGKIADMRIFIPTNGTKMVLREAWTFQLFYERRNENFIHELRGAGFVIPEPNKYHDWRDYDTCQFLCNLTLPMGTELTVSRVYIRQGNKDFDSITFNSKLMNQKKVVFKGRFWVKLFDANTMEVNLL